MIFYGNEHIVIDFDGNEQILSSYISGRNGNYDGRFQTL